MKAQKSIVASSLLLLIASLLHGAVVPGAKAAEVGLVPLVIRLPPPDSGSAIADWHVDSAHFEPIPDRPRPLLLVPPGTTNVSVRRTVTCSDSRYSSSDLQTLVDGNLHKKDCRRDFVVLRPGPQWIQVDLGAVYPLYAVVVWHCFSLPHGVFHGVVVQIADDPTFQKNVRTIFNNDYKNLAGLGEGKDKEYLETNEGKLIEAKGLRARFVRFHTAGSTYGPQNQYFGVAIYGLPH